MDTTIDQQVAVDEALVPHAKRLRIRRRNFRLLSDIKSKESTLQLVYDFLRLTPLFKALLVTTNVEHKDLKKSNEMYYPRYTKVIIHHFMSKDPSIPRRNKVNWHYVRDDYMFSMIKLVSRHQNTQQFGALLPIEITNKYIRNSNVYKEYYAVATKAAPPKPKASVWKARSSSDTTTPLTTAAGPRLTTSEKGKQAAKEPKASKTKSLSALSEVDMTVAQQLKLAPKRSLQQTHISQASGSGADEGTGSIPGVLDVPIDESEEELSYNSTDEEGDDDDDNQEVKMDDEKDDEEEGGDDEQDSDGEEFIHPSLSRHTEEEPRDKESFDPIPKTPKDSDDEGNEEENLGLNVGREEGHDEEEEEDELHRDVNINQGRGIQMTQEVEESHVTLTPVNPDGQQQSSSVSSQFVTSMLNPTLDVETNFSEFMQTNQFARAVSAIPGIIQRYMDQRMNEAVKVAVQIQSNRLRDETQKENDEFLKTIDENVQKIITEQVKERVKALVEAYEFDKIILNTYGETVTVKRCRNDDADKDEEPSAGPDQGSKRRREGKEPELASALKEKATRSAGRPPFRWKSPHIQSLTQDNVDSGTNRLRQTCPLGSLPLGCKRQQFYGFAVNRESARDVYSKHRIIDVTELKIVEWHNYKHLDWITRCVKDLQLRVESYQKKLNLTKSDTYRSDLKCKEAYTAYSDPRGFIYQNKDKKNRLIRIDELHKFSDGTLTDVRTTLDDRHKGIRMRYLPQSFWRKSDKDRAAAMIQAIDKMLKTKRITRSLERFVGGRLYEGDFRMLQRTI
nr:hypothetical protein [Tanacetum cinerariifolium]